MLVDAHMMEMFEAVDDVTSEMLSKESLQKLDVKIVW